jgi:hypothetical protein
MLAAVGGLSIVGILVVVLIIMATACCTSRLTVLTHSYRPEGRPPCR